MDLDAMFSSVRTYVEEERHRLGIERVDTLSKAEPSGEAYDEFELLLDRQLLTTSFGYGGWQELNDPTVLERVHSIIQRRRAR